MANLTAQSIQESIQIVNTQNQETKTTLTEVKKFRGYTLKSFLRSLLHLSLFSICAQSTFCGAFYILSLKFNWDIKFLSSVQTSVQIGGQTVPFPLSSNKFLLSILFTSLFCAVTFSLFKDLHLNKVKDESAEKKTAQLIAFGVVVQIFCTFGRELIRIFTQSMKDALNVLDKKDGQFKALVSVFCVLFLVEIVGRSLTFISRYALYRDKSSSDKGKAQVKDLKINLVADIGCVLVGAFLGSSLSLIFSFVIFKRLKILDGKELYLPEIGGVRLKLLSNKNGFMLLFGVSIIITGLCTIFVREIQAWIVGDHRKLVARLAEKVFIPIDKVRKLCGEAITEPIPKRNTRYALKARGWKITRDCLSVLLCALIITPVFNCLMNLNQSFLEGQTVNAGLWLVWFGLTALVGLAATLIQHFHSDMFLIYNDNARVVDIISDPLLTSDSDFSKNLNLGTQAPINPLPTTNLDESSPPAL